MKGQIGYWGHSGGGIVVSFGDEMLKWLDRQGTERRVAIIIESDRSVTVLPDAEGLAVSPCGQASHRDFRHCCSSVVHGEKSIRIRDAVAISVGFIPFGLTVLEFEETDTGLQCQLPDECDLAWPKLDPGADYGRDIAVVAEEVLQARLLSLSASGYSTFKPQQRPGDAFRRLLPVGAWSRCLATARSLSSGCLA